MNLLRCVDINLWLGQIVKKLQRTGVQLSDRLACLCIMETQLMDPLDTIMLWCSISFKGVLNWVTVMHFGYLCVLWESKLKHLKQVFILTTSSLKIPVRGMYIMKIFRPFLRVLSIIMQMENVNYLLKL